jgi:3-dehydroquinate synthetase
VPKADAPILLNGALPKAELGYPIVVGEQLAGRIAEFARRRSVPVVILCDVKTEVAAIAQRITAALGRTPVLAFRLGESRKRLSTLERVLDAMLAAGVERTTLVLGVGGGVASDLFGFAAAAYMRGVSYAHVATSLVAMVDAGIGGKTGVNLRGGKNLAGSFNDPVAVFCELTAIRTLPRSAVREGLAEVVKAAIIEGDGFFENLEALAPQPLSRWPWAEVISAAVAVKAAAVAGDRLEGDGRARLNLGHTFAHAIEHASGYRVPHGAAVALGLRAAGLLALQSGRFSEREHLRVLALLTLLGLPLQTEVDSSAILSAMRSDKKKHNSRLRFVLPRAIGDVEFGVECNERSVRAVLSRLQRAPEKAPRPRRAHR